MKIFSFSAFEISKTKSPDEGLGYTLIMFSIPASKKDSRQFLVTFSCLYALNPHALPALTFTFQFFVTKFTVMEAVPCPVATTAPV